MIKVSCSGCGRRLEAPDEAAGKKARCPGCGAVFELSASLAGSCPGCGADCPGTAVICTACGINLVTGARIAAEEPEEAPGARNAGIKLLFEGAFAGALLGAVVLVSLMLGQMVANRFLGGSGPAAGNLQSVILSRVITGVVWGSIVGVATVLTRSPSAGIIAGMVLFAAAAFFNVRSVLGSKAGFIITVAAFALSGVVVYAASFAVAKGVMAGVRWGKYR